MQRFDVIVVGGGPAGAVAARVAAEAQAKVLLLERRALIEGPAPCAGLVSPRTLAVLGASEACVVRRPREASFHAPDGTTLSVRTTSDRALVIDRSILERELLGRAHDAGATLQLGKTATAWRGGILRVEGPSGEEDFECAILVGADGPESRVAEWAGLPAGRCLHAIQVEAEQAGPETGTVQIFVGRHVAPGFFAWSIPAQPGRTRIGLAVRDGVDPGPYFSELLEQRFPDCRVASRIKGLIPIPSDRPTTADGVLLVGDAAGHVKPLSGGGLYFGGMCARIAGRAAARAAEEPRACGDHLRRYAAACRGLIGPEIRFGAAARTMCDALDDPAWSEILATLHHRDLLALVAERIDLDHLRHMVPHLVSRPRLWRPLFAVWEVARAQAHGARGAEFGVGGKDTAGSGIAGSQGQFL
jgi:geranylgeranyl reductase family protein